MHLISLSLISSKQTKLIMKKYAFFLVSLCLAGALQAQLSLTMLPSGGNKKASVSEQVGLTNITIHYTRPAVKGREGKIWGGLVHTGYTDQGFGNTKTAPWRAGANENTTIEFSNDVTIEGQPLKAGKYGFFIAYDSTESTLIFSNNATSWGSYFYNEAEDALRVKVAPQPLANSVEWLQFVFEDQTENSATIALQWEKRELPFKVEVDYVKDQLASLNRELRTERGFYWLAWQQAAQWALQRNVALEQALQWADSASGPSFGGGQLFAPKATKAQILYKLGRKAEGDVLMKEAMPLANMTELHQYARQLLIQKQAKEALEIFKLNHSKHPGQFTTLVGLMRGYSANGDYKNALKYAKQALPLSPPDANKSFVEGAIKKLEGGQDIN